MKKEKIKIVCTYGGKENIADIITDSFRRYVNCIITEEYETIQEKEKNNICMGEWYVF